MPTSLLKCSKHFNDLQICKKGMSRSIFTRKIKWDVIFVQYCKSFYTLRHKQMLHVLYNIIDISRKLFVNCAGRYQDCEVYVSFFKCLIVFFARRLHFTSTITWRQCDYAAYISTTFHCSCTILTLTVPLCYRWWSHLRYRFCCSIEYEIIFMTMYTRSIGYNSSNTIIFYKSNYL